MNIVTVILNGHFGPSRQEGAAGGRGSAKWGRARGPASGSRRHCAIDASPALCHATPRAARSQLPGHSKRRHRRPRNPGLGSCTASSRRRQLGPGTPPSPPSQWPAMLRHGVRRIATSARRAATDHTPPGPPSPYTLAVSKAQGIAPGLTGGTEPRRPPSRGALTRTPPLGPPPIPH